jgi:thymidylate synthase
MNIYLPYKQRTPDFQYRRALRHTLPPRGVYTKNPFQIRGTYTNLVLAPLVFDLANGIPLITERKVGFWQKFIAEIIGFINGARTLEDLRQYGDKKTWPNFWEYWWSAEKSADFGLEPGDGGPGGYGPVLHDYPASDGTSFNQIAAVLAEARDYPGLRTHVATTWRPDLALQSEGRQRQVVVAPCHGTVLKLTIIDERLSLTHVQRSCDMPVGGVGNIFQYAVLAHMFAQVLGIRAHQYIHYFIDAQVYENQIPWVNRLIRRRPRSFPTLRIIDPTIRDIFAFRPEHFKLTDYHPHPAMNDIPTTP